MISHSILKTFYFELELNEVELLTCFSCWPVMAGDTGLCVTLGIPAAIMSPEQCLTHNERLINFGDSH